MYQLIGFKEKTCVDEMGVDPAKTQSQSICPQKNLFLSMKPKSVAWQCSCSSVVLKKTEI